MKSTCVGKAILRWNALAQNEQGTAITEYALVTVFIGFAGLVLFKLLPAAIRAYVEVIYFVASLPVP
jgi:Flp pilus assembly pilin Flp